MELKRMARLARAGDRVLTWFAGFLVLLMLLYGGYSLWDTNNVMNGGFISDELLHYKPTGANDCARLQELMAKNSDVVGWVTIDGTNIDYPFVQGKDNQEYLNKNVLGESAVSGAVFLDTRNSRAMTDSYNLLYAHHMDNGAMFGDVDRFLDRGFFDLHRTGTLYTKDGAFRLRIVAVCSFAASDDIIFGPGNLDQASMQTLLTHVSQTAVHENMDDVGPDARIIALSTCSDKTNGRRALIAEVL